MNDELLPCFAGAKNLLQFLNLCEMTAFFFACLLAYLF